MNRPESGSAVIQRIQEDVRRMSPYESVTRTLSHARDSLRQDIPMDPVQLSYLLEDPSLTWVAEGLALHRDLVRSLPLALEKFPHAPEIEERRLHLEARLTQIVDHICRYVLQQSIFTLPASDREIVLSARLIIGDAALALGEITEMLRMLDASPPPETSRRGKSTDFWLSDLD